MRPGLTKLRSTAAALLGAAILWGAVAFAQSTTGQQTSTPPPGPAAKAKEAGKTPDEKEQATQAAKEERTGEKTNKFGLKTGLRMDAKLPPETLPAEAEAGGELKKFGYAFFAEARATIQKRRALIDPEATVNAIENLAGPNVFVPIPERYQLGPGDKLTIRVSSRTVAAQTFEESVDSRGSLALPLGGPRIIVRGQTLAQVEGQIRREMRGLVRNAEVSVRLSELRTITASVVGESFAPGTYQLPAMASVFNLLYLTGGPTEQGTLRRIQLKRGGESLKTFDFYSFLLRGDNSLDTPLQPGDVIFIPPAESRVEVKGEVLRPGVFEVLQGERLRTVLNMAGGIKPSGVGQRVSVESVTPGKERKLVDANVSSQDVDQNPPIYNGDTIQVFSVRPVLANAVNLTGPVDQPGQYAITKGMTIADLIERARGLLPEATNRADIFRERDDKTLQLIRVDLAKAMTRSAADNPALEPNDKVVVYSTDVTTWLQDRYVTVKGAVKNPGQFPRAEGMSVQDVIFQAGGLLPNASLELAFVQRENPDGTPGPLERIDIRKVAQNDPAHNVILKDRDVLIIQSVQEATFTPDFAVEVTGSVQRPGSYRLAQGMTVKDVLALSGNPLPDAYLDKAFIQRTSKDGTVGPLISVSLKKALAGDPANNVTLEHKDILNVYSLEQAKYIVEQVVTIRGGVQRPGEYPSSTNMTLEDLIDLAGGLLPDAAGTADISAAWKPINEVPQTIAFVGAPGTFTVPRTPIKPGDTILVPQNSLIVQRAPIVTILGSVKNPGAYVISDDTRRVSQIIRKAGGLLSDSFPEGTEFVRDPKFLATSMQMKLQPKINEVLQQVAEDSYKRVSALIDLDRLKLVFSKGVTLSIPVAGGAAKETSEDAAITLDSALAKALSSNSATPARKLTDRDLLPAGNLNVRIPYAVRSPGSRDDLELRDGDVIMIPTRPTSVNVVGAVALPASILFRDGSNAAYYVERAGGFTQDADQQSVLVIRATGELLKYKRGMKIQLGDLIFIPTKVQAIRIKDSGREIDNAMQTVTSAAATLAIIRSLGR